MFSQEHDLEPCPAFHLPLLITSVMSSWKWEYKLFSVTIGSLYQNILGKKEKKLSIYSYANSSENKYTHIGFLLSVYEWGVWWWEEFEFNKKWLAAFPPSPQMLTELWIQCLVQSIIWFLSFGLEDQCVLSLDIPDSSTCTSFQLCVSVLLHREGLQSLPLQGTHPEKLNRMPGTVRPQRGFSFSWMTFSDPSCLRPDLKQRMILFVTSYWE